MAEALKPKEKSLQDVVLFICLFVWLTPTQANTHRSLSLPPSCAQSGAVCVGEPFSNPAPAVPEAPCSPWQSLKQVDHWAPPWERNLVPTGRWWAGERQGYCSGFLLACHSPAFQAHSFPHKAGHSTLDLSTSNPNSSWLLPPCHPCTLLSHSQFLSTPGVCFEISYWSVSLCGTDKPQGPRRKKSKTSLFFQKSCVACKLVATRWLESSCGGYLDPGCLSQPKGCRWELCFSVAQGAACS